MRQWILLQKIGELKFDLNRFSNCRFADFDSHEENQSCICGEINSNTRDESFLITVLRILRTNKL